MTTKLFSELGISPELVKAIDRLGFEQAAPIQVAAIPPLMQGRDVVGQSQTGSGKTAAFAIPAIEKVDVHLRAVQVIILCPTRELAVQVSEEVHKLALFKRGIHALPVYGGQSYERQFYGLKQGAQIVIGTPGRVMDHMRRGTLRLDKVRMAILDEADVMLDMGFRDDIEFILKALPPERQTVFFSATLPRIIQELIKKYARDPLDVRIEQKAVTVPTVEQVYYEVDRRFKVELLTRLIDLHDLKLGIIFCNTKRMVDDLVDHLNAQGYSADRLHGDLTQGMRDRVMNNFRKSGLEFLVATDVAARGIDVDNVQAVFNYDLPYDGEDYVHRIGRTGRVGRKGLAISFVSGRELFQIQQIERYTKTRIHRAKAPTATEVETARQGVFLSKVRATLQSGEFKQQDHLIEVLLEEGFTSTDIASALMHHLQQEETPGAARAASHSSSSLRGERGPRTVETRKDGPPPPGPLVHRMEERVRSVSSIQPRPSVDRPKFGAPSQETLEGREQRPAQTRDLHPRPERQPIQTRPGPAPVQRAQGRTVAPAPKPIPASTLVKPEFKATPSGLKKPAQGPVAGPPKHSRHTPENQTRIFMNIGTEMAVGRDDILRIIQGETGLPAAVIGEVDIRERHAFVDVLKEHAATIVGKLNRTRLRDNRLKVKFVKPEIAPEGALAPASPQKEA